MERSRYARELLRKVARQIEVEPDKYDQSTWGVPDDPDSDVIDDYPDAIRSACGTSACVAGWAIRLAGPRKYAAARCGFYSGYADTVGAKLLELSDSEASLLFFFEYSRHEMPSVLRYLARYGELPERRKWTKELILKGVK